MSRPQTLTLSSKLSLGKLEALGTNQTVSLWWRGESASQREGAWPGPQ